MKIKNKKGFLNLRISVLICVLFVFVMNLFAYAGWIENIHILKISPQDERAIIKTPDGKMQIIKVGDELQVAGYGLRVIEITKWRIVIEEKTDKGIETVIIRLEDGKQRVERIRKTADKQPVMYKPIHEGHENTQRKK